LQLGFDAIGDCITFLVKGLYDGLQRRQRDAMGFTQRFFSYRLNL
jgi:hypothetical protein